MSQKKLVVLGILVMLLFSLPTMLVGQDMPVITWRFPVANAAGLTDLRAVEVAANEIIEPAIGARLELIPIELGAEYDTVLTTMAASGEVCDLVYTSWWTFDYWQKAALGAFLPLGDLLEAHAPTILAKFPDYIWATATVDGEVYAIPHTVRAAGPHGWVLMREMVEKHNFDVGSIEEFTDVEPLLAAIIESDPDLIVLTHGRNGTWEAFSSIHNLEEIIGGDTGVGFRRDEAGVTVIDMFTTPEYREFLEIQRRWWNDNYVWDEAPFGTPGRINEGVVATFTNRDLISPTANFGGKEYINVPLGPAIIRRNTALPHSTAICRTSQNADKAVMLMDLIHSNRELVNLLTFGIEGRHYELDAEGRVVSIPDSGYDYSRRTWMFGDEIADTLRWATEAPDFLDLHAAALEASIPSKLLGFQLDTEPIRAELSQLQAVVDEYLPQLNTGAGNYEELLPAFLEQRQAVGIDNIIAEIQSQIDAWLAGE
jgi:putative aldouronate transport system substrate-binding protein